MSQGTNTFEELKEKRRETVLSGIESGLESPAAFYPDNLQTMKQEFAADRVNAAQESISTSSTQNASNEGASPLTADEMHDENFRRMFDKYYSEVDDGQQEDA